MYPGVVTDPILDDLLLFLEHAPTPFHAVAQAAEALDNAGFRALAEADPWSDLAPGRYHATVGGSSLVAFVVPKGPHAAFRLVGAHTDSPNLRLKPRPEYAKEGYLQLGVEVYGGALLNSWLDRDLSLAGRVFVESGGRTSPVLVKIDRPLCRVAQLAIHLDRDQNEKLALNRQEHLAPLLGLAGPSAPSLTALLARELEADASAIRAMELMLYDVAGPAVSGIDGEFIHSGRLDNLAMCHAATTALTLAAGAAEAGGVVPMIALFDHEEVGSESATGAHSAFLPRALERISAGRGLSRDQHFQALARSFCVSADMAHAVHPNFADRHEARHKPVLGGGPVIKTNAQQRYATSAATALLFERICARADVPFQHYAHRTDLPCGTTIGPITSTLLGIPTVDVGNPMLSMHSARELAGTRDPALMTRALACFLEGAD